MAPKAQKFHSLRDHSEIEEHCGEFLAIGNSEFDTVSELGLPMDQGINAEQGISRTVWQEQQEQKQQQQQQNLSSFPAAGTSRSADTAHATRQSPRHSSLPRFSDLSPYEKKRQFRIAVSAIGQHLSDLFSFWKGKEQDYIVSRHDPLQPGLITYRQFEYSDPDREARRQELSMFWQHLDVVFARIKTLMFLDDTEWNERPANPRLAKIGINWKALQQDVKTVGILIGLGHDHTQGPGQNTATASEDMRQSEGASVLTTSSMSTGYANDQDRHDQVQVPNNPGTIGPLGASSTMRHFSITQFQGESVTFDMNAQHKQGHYERQDLSAISGPPDTQQPESLPNLGSGSQIALLGMNNANGDNQYNQPVLESGPSQMFAAPLSRDNQANIPTASGSMNHAYGQMALQIQGYEDLRMSPGRENRNQFENRQRQPERASMSMADNPEIGLHQAYMYAASVDQMDLKLLK